MAITGGRAAIADGFSSTSTPMKRELVTLVMVQLEALSKQLQEPVGRTGFQPRHELCCQSRSDLSWLEVLKLKTESLIGKPGFHMLNGPRILGFSLPSYIPGKGAGLIEFAELKLGTGVSSRANVTCQSRVCLTSSHKLGHL